jgi:DNA-binding transcriptional ArsR family regulator
MMGENKVGGIRVRKMNLQGRSLLVACLFMVSIFIVVLKLMNPTEVHIFLEGEETVLSQVMRNFTLYDVIMLITAAFSAGISATYLLFYDRGLATGDIAFNGKRSSYEKVLPTLKDDEQKVFQAVLDSDGIIAQSDLSDLTGVSKSNVSRALDLLESRGYVERRRRGMGNIIVLK